jgi:uncharacterized protein YdaU (DUF1376 family)
MAGTRANTWMPLYIGDYLADTMHLGMAEHGAYLLLIFSYWRSGTPLPDNDKHLAGICKASAAEWQDIRPTLAGFFQISDGVWRHKRIEKELADATASYERRKAAADARWLHSKCKADALHEQSQPQSHSSLRSEIDTPHVPPGSKRGIRLPDDWQPCEQSYQLGAGLGFSRSDVDGEVPEFRDFWVGVPGQKGCKLDWDATFNNRLRTVAKHRAERAQRSGRMVHRQKPNSLIAAASAVLAQIEGEQ